MPNGYSGFEGDSIIQFPVGDYNKLVIDGKHWGIDWNRKNNEAYLDKKGIASPPQRFVWDGKR